MPIIPHWISVPEQEWWDAASWDKHSKEIMLMFEQRWDTSSKNEYDQKIFKTECEINNIQNIILEYTGKRVEYQTVYTNKKNKIEELMQEYKKIQWDTMTEEDRKQYERKQQEFENMWKEIFWFMWFDQLWARWRFSSEEEFFNYQKQEDDRRKNENHIKKDIAEIRGTLVEQLRWLSIKDIWRKASKLLHPDKLIHNKGILWDEDYLNYCKELFEQLANYYEKEDIWSMILVLQEAGIQFKDWKFILPSLEERSIIQNISKSKKILIELEERLLHLKQSYIYIFYLKFEQWDIEKEIYMLDNKIEELQDIIASYWTINNEQ